jgi:hypothetical protein
LLGTPRLRNPLFSGISKNGQRLRGEAISFVEAISFGNRGIMMRTPTSMSDYTRRGFIAAYEMELSPEAALAYLSDPTNFLTIHAGIVRELNFLGDSGNDDELYAAFLRRVKNSKTKISGFCPREQPESGKACRWFYNQCQQLKVKAS